MRPDGGRRLTSFGVAGDGKGEFNYPNVSAVTDGLVYVAGAGNNRIQVVDTMGRFVAAWGSEGAGPGEFEIPVGLAIDAAGGIYVAVIRNNRIQKLHLRAPLTPGIPVASP